MPAQLDQDRDRKTGLADHPCFQYAVDNAEASKRVEAAIRNMSEKVVGKLEGIHCELKNGRTFDKQFSQRVILIMLAVLAATAVGMKVVEFLKLV